MESGVKNLLQWRVFNLLMEELGHIPCRHILKEDEGFNCALSSSFTRATSKPYSLGASLCSHNVLYKVVYGEVPYLVHNPTILHLTEEGQLRLTTMVKRIAQ